MVLLLQGKKEKMAAAPVGRVFQFKLVLLGDSAVGKSSLVLRFVRGQFFEYQESTIGAAFLTQTVALNDTTVKFEIWDTAGQERYHSLAPMYYRGAAAAIVVYDITREVRLLRSQLPQTRLPAATPLTCVPRMLVQPSFKTLQNWVQELQSLGPENIVIAIAGNKCDCDDIRAVAGRRDRLRLGLRRHQLQRVRSRVPAVSLGSPVAVPHSGPHQAQRHLLRGRRPRGR